MIVPVSHSSFFISKTKTHSSLLRKEAQRISVTEITVEKEQNANELTEKNHQ